MVSYHLLRSCCIILYYTMTHYIIFINLTLFILSHLIYLSHHMAGHDTWPIQCSVPCGQLRYSLSHVYGRVRSNHRTSGKGSRNYGTWMGERERGREAKWKRRERVSELEGGSWRGRWKGEEKNRRETERQSKVVVYPLKTSWSGYYHGTLIKK